MPTSTFNSCFNSPYKRWASIQNVWCAQHSAQLSYILYGDFSHTFLWDFFNSEGPILATWASDSHTFCMGISLIHFVWGFSHLYGVALRAPIRNAYLRSLIHFVWGFLYTFCMGFLSYILYGDCFNSWMLRRPPTPLIVPTPTLHALTHSEFKSAVNKTTFSRPFHYAVSDGS